MRNFVTTIAIILGVLAIVCVAFHPAYAGEFPNKTTKEKTPIEEQGQKPKKPENLPAAETPQSKGGCLIATATYGSELAPQVQLLREIRDNALLKTGSGTGFMTAFDAVYYTFSPTVSDWERENHLFKEIVKAVITPMLSTLSILKYVDVDTEQEMLGYGIAIILLNIGMYFATPAFLILGFRKLHKDATKFGETT